MKWISKLWKKFVVWKYVNASLDLGNADSYMIACGPCCGRERLVRKQQRWEKRYAALGYEPITPYNWEAAGGWGDEHKHLLYKPKSYPGLLI